MKPHFQVDKTRKRGFFICILTLYQSPTLPDQERHYFKDKNDDASRFSHKSRDALASPRPLSCRNCLVCNQRHQATLPRLVETRGLLYCPNFLLIPLLPHIDPLKPRQQTKDPDNCPGLPLLTKLCLSDHCPNEK